MEPIYIADYNYPLPDERSAKYPLAERDQSKLLVYGQGTITEDHFYNVGKYILPDALLVYNNTRVIQARLEFHKRVASADTNAMPAQGARIEVFCLEPLKPNDYQLSLSSTRGCVWNCMVGNAKKWKGEEPLPGPPLKGRKCGQSPFRSASRREPCRWSHRGQ